LAGEEETTTWNRLYEILKQNRINIFRTESWTRFPKMKTIKELTHQANELKHFETWWHLKRVAKGSKARVEITHGATKWIETPQILPITQGDARIEAAINRMISGHTFIGQYYERMKIEENKICKCGRCIETIQHVIWDCPEYDEPRKRYIPIRYKNKPEKERSQKLIETKIARKRLYTFMKETNTIAFKKTQPNPLSTTA
jgi:hypothetical protein